MRTRVVPVAVIASFALVSVASAATMSGIIRSYDPEARQIVLDNGYRYALKTAAESLELKTGDHVEIDWRTFQNGIRLADSVRITSPARILDYDVGYDYYDTD